MSTTTHLMTAEELIKLPRGQFRYELVKGELLTMSPTGGKHGILLARISHILLIYADKIKAGIVYGGDTGFVLERGPDTVLAPDVAFVFSDRAEMHSEKYLNDPPDLIVEVLSPSERKSRIEWKTNQWFGFGVRSVWLVNPKSRTVQVVSATGDNRSLKESDELTDDVLPGFSVLVSEIFT
jgi:Uma2 family endonuclease